MLVFLMELEEFIARKQAEAKEAAAVEKKEEVEIKEAAKPEAEPKVEAENKDTATPEIEPREEGEKKQ